MEAFKQMRKLILKQQFIHGYIKACYLCGYLYPYKYRIKFKILSDYFRGQCFCRHFKKCGKELMVGKRAMLRGLNYVMLGDNVSFDDGVCLTLWPEFSSDYPPSMSIGNNCNFGAYNHITCVNCICIGDNCLTGKYVTISDNSHGNTDAVSLSMPPNNRAVVSKGGVKIGNNVWIGDKATILPGVTIGNGCIVAANSVVTKSVPDNCVVAGVPAIIVKSIK